MGTLLRWSIYLPLAVLIIWFALANRGSVTISLDALQTGDLAAYRFEAPLFLVVMAAMAIGVVAGGLASWLSHGSVRRSARLARAEAKRAQDELDKLRRQALAELPSANTAKRTTG
ncbi:MAG TPA: LapA family protein [Methylocystis sp.]|nr:LapA family protein [Methylocystis sp.]